MPETLALLVRLCSRCARARGQELCESRGGRPGLPVPNNPYGFCGRKIPLNLNSARVRAQELCESEVAVPSSLSLSVCGLELCARFRAQELCESRGGRPELPVPISLWI